MEKQWILSVMTNFFDRKNCPFSCKMATKYYVFDDFRTGRKKMLEEIARIRKEGKAMFDENGDLIYLNRYITKMEKSELNEEYLKSCDEESLLADKMKEARRLLRGVMNGVETNDTKLDGFFTDYSVGLQISGGYLIICGDDDGPSNGYDPDILTNMLTVTEEKNCYFHLRDNFGQNHDPSYVFLELKKSEN